MRFQEDTRVQIPAIVHLTRLGYKYIGKISENQKGTFYDENTNILIPYFKDAFNKLNPGQENQFDQTFRDITNELDNDDLGRSFYKRLTAVSPIKLIDFDNPDNNTYQVTAEFTCKRDQDSFRPDITIFINGLPLCFIEVKKPHNHEGILAEFKRMNYERFPNKKFRRFMNITQLMIFSNNMEYDTLGGIVPVQGAFYCTTAHKKPFFNCFREENPKHSAVAPFIQNFPYKDIDTDTERKIIFDFNAQVIRETPEYITNKDVNTPTNRIITSMCSRERFLFLIKYGIAYVKSEREEDGKIVSKDEKHIMRYQQMFGAMAIENKLKEGVKSGIVWHTQGSGKTALSYYLNSILSDYYAKQNIVAKFYFIVDRLDLLEQASQEFEARGIKVTTAQSRNELMQQFRTQQSLTGHSGQAEICVVNIQKFKEDNTAIDLPVYATKLQRIFILDEAHRGYRPGGCFLANLFDADKNSIKIALTGTPLLKAESASTTVFKTYLHTYYYDRSIADGYTLKIIREDISTSYKEKLQETYDSIEHLVQKKDIKKAQIIEHENYVDELIRYIITDLRDFRAIQGDDTLGGMIICETSEQARKIYEDFNKVQTELNKTEDKKTDFKIGLILHDHEDKETRKKIIKDFKKNYTIDILVVFNMLLTGFDAPRLKRLYFGRKLQDHNLLQAITRVNRPYKDMRYGFVIDFADIKSNFEQTNQAYLAELNKFNDPEQLGAGVDCNTLTQILEDPENIKEQLKEIRQILFRYTTDNVEIFSSEIGTLEDKQELLKLRKALISAKDCLNLVRTFGTDEQKEEFKKLEIPKLPQMLAEVNHHIENINMKETLTNQDATNQMINKAMLNIKFKFSRIGEEELEIVAGEEQLQEKYANVIECASDNYDQEDPEYIALIEALRARFREHNFKIDTVAKYNEEMQAMDEIMKKLKRLQEDNRKILAKYSGDVKYARIHKRIKEENIRRKLLNKEPIISKFEEDILNTLADIKMSIDQQIYDRSSILKRDAYFEQTVNLEIAKSLNKFPNIKIQAEDYAFISKRISGQYMNQYKNTYAL